VRPTAWWCVIVPPFACSASLAAFLITCHASSTSTFGGGATNV
jgi:hypothetical protein